MKKYIFTILIFALIGTSVAQAQIFPGVGFWKILNGFLQPTSNTRDVLIGGSFNASSTAHITGLTLFGSDIGASADRISKGWFTDLDTTTLTIGSYASGNLTVRQDLYVNGNDFNLGNGVSTSTLSGTGTSTFQGGISANHLALTKAITQNGNGTSTFTGGIFANAFRFNQASCTGTNALNLDSDGSIVCGAVTLSAAGGWTDDGTVVRLTTATDDVGVGTTTPWGILSVEMDGSNTRAFVVGDTGTSSPAFIVKGNGNVGIGTTGPGSKLEVENTGSANDVLLLEDSSGLCEAEPATTGLTWACSSDIRLKTNIRDASPVLTYIAGIPLRDYTVIKTGENVMGPVAQELQELYPELVREGDDGYLQVSALSPWQMVKAIQEIWHIIINHESRFEKLEKQNEFLLERIEALESKERNVCYGY